MTEEDYETPCHKDVGRSRLAEVSRALPKAEYIEKKFDEFVLTLKPIASQKHTRDIPAIREYFIKLTPDKIQNWCEITKQELLELTIPELLLKYTALKHEKEREYGM